MSSTKSNAIILSSLGIISAATFLFNLGMSIWGFVVQSEIKSEKNDEKCSASIVSDLLLAYSILIIISAVGAIFHFLGATIDRCLLKSDESSPKKSRPCYSLSQCCFSIVGVGASAVLIAMTVYLYKDSCKDLRATMYALVSPYVITQYVAYFIFNLCSVIIMSCIQCLGVFGVALATSDKV